jgi:hypothetical protein
MQNSKGIQCKSFGEQAADSYYEDARKSPHFVLEFSMHVT